MSHEDNDLVSIIINTYYRNDTLRTAIESALDQSHENIEVLVVDDSGEGYAKPVVTEYDVEYIQLKQSRGLTSARYIGLKHSDGRYIQFLDDDDWLYQDKIAKQLELFEQSSDVGVVYCGYKLGTDDMVYPDPDVTDDILKHTLMFQTRACKPSTALIRREMAEEILPGNDDLWHAEDLWMWIELAELTEFDFVDEILTFRGADDDSLGTSIATANTIFKIINIYEHIYDQYPSQIKKQALSNAHFRRGRSLMRKQVWSGTAIKEFITSLYIVPEADIERCGYLAMSLFGKPGYVLGSTMYKLFPRL